MLLALEEELKYLVQQRLRLTCESLRSNSRVLGGSMAVPMVVTLPASMVSLYVGDLHPNIVDETLFDVSKKFKGITSVHVCRDSSIGRSLCYGYANFSSLQDGDR
ncbi:hypothetical protein V6N13_004757 [Hibiscus sabdariffa]